MREIPNLYLSPSAGPAKTERLPRPDESNLVFRNLVGLDGTAVSDTILERITDYPELKRVVFFGVGGSSKTTNLLEMRSQLERIAPDIEVNPYFYDDALAAVRRTIRPTAMTDRVHNAVSDFLSETIDLEIPEELDSVKNRGVQAIELVGVGSKNRGRTTLEKIMADTRAQHPMASEAFIIGVVPDARTLRDAASLRDKIRDLEEPTDIFSVLVETNVRLSGIPEDLDPEFAADEIIAFYSRMATGRRIHAVRDALYRDARYLAFATNYGLDSQINLPLSIPPFRRTSDLEHFKVDAAFMQYELAALGAIPSYNVFDLSFNPSRDKGIVVFNPYNPSLPKDLDLGFLFKTPRDHTAQLAS